MNQLEKIEQKFNFKYPELYKQLYKDGMLDGGRKFESDWYATYWNRLKKNPPLLLFTYNFELLDMEMVTEEIEAFIDPDDYRATKPEFQFTPFGQNSVGDLYVFQLDKQTDENVPITFVYHDMDNAVILAKNLQDFIFRKLLECVSEIDEYSHLMKNGKFVPEYLVNIFRTHSPYLKEQQTTILKEVYNRDLVNYKAFQGFKPSINGLILHDELVNIIQQEISFNELNKEFSYMG